MKSKTVWKDKIDYYVKSSITKAKEKGVPVICRCGETPGGTKHIGNFNDNMRSYFIYLEVKEKGYPAMHIQTRDNMDPFRKLPEYFFDLNKKWHKSSPKQIKEYTKYVGTPLFFIPDPLGCCKNYSEHFRKIYESECKIMGLKNTQYFSTADLYLKGKFNPYLKKIFNKIDVATKINNDIEESKPKNYIPVWVICPKCRKITGRIGKIDVKRDEVEYKCTDRNLTLKYTAKGCGHEGKIDWKNGNTKMDWEFEWPAQMLMFNTTIEPFGKEHYIGSWPFAKKVITDVYDEELPITFFYEYFLMGKKKMATRHGNVIPLSSLLKVLEPEVIRFIYTKRPRKQRNLDLSNIFHWTNEFDRAEKIYFKKIEAKNEKEKEILFRNYKLAYLNNPPKEFPKKISYKKCVKIVENAPKKLWKSFMPKNVGFNKKVEKRLELANYWLKNYKIKNLNFLGL